MSLIKVLLVIFITVLAMVYSVLAITKQSAPEVDDKFKTHAIIKPKSSSNGEHALNAKMLAPQNSIKKSPNSIKSEILSRREVL